VPPLTAFGGVRRSSSTIVPQTQKNANDFWSFFGGKTPRRSGYSDRRERKLFFGSSGGTFSS
jgi:hypothetical protein